MPENEILKAYGYFSITVVPIDYRRILNEKCRKKTHLYPRIREMWSLIAGMVLKGIVSYVYPVIVRKANDKCYFRTSLAVGVGVLMNFPTYSYWEPNIHPSSLSRWGSVISLGCTPDKSYGKLTTPDHSMLTGVYPRLFRFTRVHSKLNVSTPDHSGASG